MPRVTVVGSCNVDQIYRVPRLPQVGETLVGHRYLMAAGGKGLNQALAAARLDVGVSLVACVGSDVYGDYLLDLLHGEEMDLSHVQRSPDQATGVAGIFVDDHGSNAIVITAGANGQLAAAHVEMAATTIAASDMVILQQEVPTDANRTAARIARANGVPVLLNAAPARPISPALMELITILNLNEVEAEQLSGGDVRAPDGLVNAARHLLTLGPQTVVVTLGSAGALLATGREHTVIPTHEVTVLDTTGAGDAFCAGLAAALVKGQGLVDAVGFANACGALACTREGAANSMPTAQEVTAWLDQASS